MRKEYREVLDRGPSNVDGEVPLLANDAALEEEELDLDPHADVQADFEADHQEVSDAPVLRNKCELVCSVHVVGDNVQSRRSSHRRTHTPVGKQEFVPGGKLPLLIHYSIGSEKRNLIIPAEYIRRLTTEKA